MIAVHSAGETLTLAAAEQVVGVLDAAANSAAHGPAMPRPERLASLADGVNDPLAALEADLAHEDLTARIQRAEAEQEQIARRVVTQWTTVVAPGVVAVRLNKPDALAFGAWANRLYQQCRVAELENAGGEVTVGAGSAVDDMLAELLGPDPTHPEQVPLELRTTVFATLALAVTRAVWGQ